MKTLIRGLILLGAGVFLLMAAMAPGALLSQNLPLAPYARLQFFTGAGAVCNGCLLHTYESGTTTPLATYQNAAGTTPHANPIVMDSGGRAPAGIFLTSGTSYRFVLATSADVTIWTQDGVERESGVGLSGTTGFLAMFDAAGSSVEDSNFTNLSDPDADRIMFWDDSAGLNAYLTPGAPLRIDGTNIISSWVTSITTNTTLTTSHSFVLASAGAGVFTVSLTSAAVMGNGWVFNVKKTDSSGNAVTVDPDGSETIDGDATIAIANENESYTLVSDGVNWYIQ